MLRRKSHMDELRDTINEQAQEILSLQQKLFKASDDYAALEQGMNELQEGHEQIYLDFQDAMRDVLAKNMELHRTVAEHEAFCLIKLPEGDTKNTPLDEDVSTTER